MTDRELLGLAAKAAGLIHWEENEWNPLADDGTALRLAVKLNIWPVRQYDRHAIVVQNGAAYFDELAKEPIGDDPCASTRRAIVRAAAEIGRAMP